MVIIYKINSRCLNEVSHFFEKDLGLKVKEYKVIEPIFATGYGIPASGYGKMMEVVIDIKNLKTLHELVEKKDKLEIWRTLGGEIEEEDEEPIQSFGMELIRCYGYSFIERVNKKDIPLTLKKILKEDSKSEKILEIRLIEELLEIGVDGEIGERVRNYSSYNTKDPNYGIYIKYR